MLNKVMVLCLCCLFCMTALLYAGPQDDLDALTQEITAAQKTPENISLFKNKLRSFETRVADTDKAVAARAVLEIMNLIDSTQTVTELKALSAEIDRKYPQQERVRLNAYNKIGHRLRYVKGFPESIVYFNKALPLMKKISPTHQAGILLNIASSYWKMGEKEKSFEIYRKTVDDFAKTNPRTAAKCLAEMKMQYNRLGMVKEENAIDREMISRFPQEDSAVPSAKSLAETLIKKGKQDEALDLVEHALVNVAEDPKASIGLLEVYSQILSDTWQHDRAIYIAALRFALARGTDQKELETSINTLSKVFLRADGNLARMVAFITFHRFGEAGADGKLNTKDDLKNPLLPVLERITNSSVSQVFAAELQYYKTIKKNSTGEAFIQLICGRPLTALKAFVNLKNDMIASKPTVSELTVAVSNVLGVIGIFEGVEFAYSHYLAPLTSLDEMNGAGNILNDFYRRFGSVN